MKYSLLLILPALQEVLASDFRLLKYALFPPLGLLGIAGMTPDNYRIVVRDEHVEPVELDEHFDLVAMSVYVSSANRAYQLADFYRERGAKIVLGGIHPTTRPAEAAQHADALCLGPAEAAWAQILRDFEAGFLKKFYRGRREGSAALALPARRDLMNRKAYLVRQTMVATRGCPNACDFCYKASFWGKHFYERSSLAQIERELASFDTRFVFFLDDNFLADRRWARRVFRLLREYGIIWQASASLGAARTPGYLEEAYESGCRSLFVGFESISPENMRQANKRVNLAADYAGAIRAFHDAGIMINGSFVFGFDHDGTDVFERTVDFAIRNRIETATFHILTPFPGTRFFKRMAARGRLLHRNWDLYDTRHAVFQPARMTPCELEAGHRRAYRDFYTFGSILRRSWGMPGALKRIAYNVGWKKMDRLWSFLIRRGLVPYVRPVFEHVLEGNTRWSHNGPVANRAGSVSIPALEPVTVQPDEKCDATCGVSSLHREGAKAAPLPPA